MRVLLTGHNGFIGSVLALLLVERGHEVVGLDTYFYGDCTYGPDPLHVNALSRDIRDRDAGCVSAPTTSTSSIA